MKKKMTSLLSAMLCAAMVFTAPISVCQADEPDKQPTQTEEQDGKPFTEDSRDDDF